MSNPNANEVASLQDSYTLDHDHNNPTTILETITEIFNIDGDYEENRRKLRIGSL